MFVTIVTLLQYSVNNICLFVCLFILNRNVNWKLPQKCGSTVIGLIGYADSEYDIVNNML